MSDFVLILPSLYYWPFGFVLSCMSEKEKNYSVNLFHRKLSFFKKMICGLFYGRHGYIKKYSTHKLCVASRNTISP